MHFISLNILSAHFSVSIVDERPQELMYVSLEKLHLDFTEESEQQLFEFTVARLQVSVLVCIMTTHTRTRTRTLI